ncbi:ketimine reductase mu-crystallin isoform X1 [Diabrotica undecimpunctata]|uniref:ketimine reductase mu-crystallin isoform X1 n=1 Tax=Diabrotica undecimpunctata TaxID=50387 RepID=UPI003B635D13
MIYISEDMVLRLITWDQTFQAVETAMKKYSEKQTVQNARTKTQIINKPNMLVTMPGYLNDAKYGALGCKLVSFFPGNNDLPKPMPSVLANIMLFDENSGAVKAVIGGFEITKWRTAAASAVATKHIYENRNKPCNILAILGAGQQGWAHAECFNYFFKFKEIRIWNRTSQKASQLVTELNVKHNTNIFTHVISNEECVRGADVIITVTNAPDPIIMDDWVKSGAHINAVGLGRTHHSELEEKLYYHADVYIDHWEGVNSELSGLAKLIEFKGEVGKVIMNQITTEDINRITVFQSLGMAIEDCAMSRLVYDLYIKKQKSF